MKRLGLIGIVVSLMLGLVPTGFAQQSTDACQFMQDQVGFLQTRAAELLVTATNQQAAYEAAITQLPLDMDTIRALTLDGDNPLTSREEREVYRQALQADLDVALTLDRLLNVLDQIEAFNAATFIICNQETGNTSPGQSDGSTIMENTIPQGGDEIIVQLGTYTGQFNIPRPATDTATDGWYLQVDGIVSATEVETGKVDEHTSLISFILGDDGTFLQATLFFWNGCDVSGNLSINGDTFDMVFSGNHSGTSAIIEVHAQGQILGTTLDENLRVPATASATFRRIREDGSISHEGTFTPIADGVAKLERFGTSQYRSSYCGDGIP